MHIFHKWEVAKKGYYGGISHPDRFFGAVSVCSCGKIKEVSYVKNYKLVGLTKEEAIELISPSNPL